MSNWQPGDPLYRSDEDPDEPGFDISVDTVRPIFQLIYPTLSSRTAARWPDPYDIHDLDVQEGALWQSR